MLMTLSQIKIQIVNELIIKYGNEIMDQVSSNEINNKAMLVKTDAYPLETAVARIARKYDATPVATKPAPKTASKQRVWLGYEAAYETGLNEGWITRKVSNIVDHESGYTTGVITVNFKTIEVMHSHGNEWNA